MIQNWYAKNNIKALEVEENRAKNPDDGLMYGETLMTRRAVGKMGWLVKGTRPELMPFLVDIDTKQERNNIRDFVKPRRWS